MTKQRIIKSGKEIIVVNYKLSQHGNQTPYFSITGDMGEKRRGPHRDYDMIYTETAGAFHIYAGGCIHEEIEKYFPDMKDLIRLHLSDINGVPMHAVENGFYFLVNGYERKEMSPIDSAADYLRLSEADKKRMLDMVTTDEGFMKDLFSDFVETMKPIWKAEADAAIEKYNLTIVKS